MEWCGTINDDSEIRGVVTYDRVISWAALQLGLLPVTSQRSIHTTHMQEHSQPLVTELSKVKEDKVGLHTGVTNWHSPFRYT